MKTAAIVLSGLGLLGTHHATTHHATAHGQPAAVRTVSAPAPQASPGTWWRPTNTGPNNGPEWQWELSHPLSVASPSDMGIGTTNAAGVVSATPSVYDIDAIENPASTVAALHRLGDKVICYVEIGSAGNYYAASDEGIPVTYFAQLKAAGDLGGKMAGYPEYYLNVNAPSTVSIIESMIKQQCAAKGFDAVEPDIGDSYTDNNGFGITEAQNAAYDNTLGTYAHSLGLGWGEKNGDQNPSFARMQEPVADFLLTEECNYYHTCATVAAPYVAAHKMVLNAEYTDDWGTSRVGDLRKFCAADISSGIDGTLFTSALSGMRHPCQ
jgi:hypothetical protein